MPGTLAWFFELLVIFGNFWPFLRAFGDYFLNLFFLGFLSKSKKCLGRLSLLMDGGGISLALLSLSFTVVFF